MGIPLFGVDISGLVNQHVGSGVPELTFKKVEPGTRTPGQLSGGINPVETSYTARGFQEKQADKNAAGTLVDNGTVTILLIGDSIQGGTVVPEPDDKIVIDGVEYVIEVVDRDPAAATYQCVSRKV